MITAAFRVRFKKYVPGQYAHKVQRRLEAREVFNRNGDSFKKRDIHNVFNGYRENADIEVALKEVLESAEQTKRRSEVLDAKLRTKTA